jgi:hypothetical protein
LLQAELAELAEPGEDLHELTDNAQQQKPTKEGVRPNQEAAHEEKTRLLAEIEQAQQQLSLLGEARSQQVAADSGQGDAQQISEERLALLAAYDAVVKAASTQAPNVDAASASAPTSPDKKNLKRAPDPEQRSLIAELEALANRIKDERQKSSRKSISADQKDPRRKSGQSSEVKRALNYGDLTTTTPSTEAASMARKAKISRLEDVVGKLSLRHDMLQKRLGDVRSGNLDSSSIHEIEESLGDDVEEEEDEEVRVDREARRIEETPFLKELAVELAALQEKVRIFKGQAELFDDVARKDLRMLQMKHSFIWQQRRAQNHDYVNLKAQMQTWRREWTKVNAQIDDWLAGDAGER